MAIASELDGGSKDVLPALEVALCRLKLVLRRSLRHADAVLLRLQQVEWDRVRIEGVQELASLVRELRDRLCEKNPTFRDLGLPVDDLSLELLREPAHPGARQLDPPVEILDERLGVTGKDVRLAASGARGPALAEAVEIQVLALGKGERQAPSALTAVQHALQVVLVASLAHPGDVSGFQRLLDPIEQALRDQRLVLPLVADSVPLHDADVEGIGQELGELGHGDRSARSTRVRGSEPLGVHRRLQLGKRVLPGRVQPEALADEEGALGIEDDLGDLLAGDLVSNVQVADGRLRRPAAHLGLLGHTLSDLTGQVGRVELGHERVDALHEPPRGRLLDVLGHRDELHPRVPKCGSDRHVVLHGAGQAIDLVDDDYPDAAFGHATEERFEHRAVRGARRLAGVRELPGNVPPALGNVAKAGLPLCGDGVALAGLVLGGLLLRGHPEVDHRVHRSSSSPAC